MQIPRRAGHASVFHCNCEMGAFMRESRSLKEGTFIACVIVVLIGISVLACRDPEDFQPDDPYTEAPAPPDLIYPVADTSFNGTVVNVYCNWTVVTGGESYEVQYDTSISYPSEWRETSAGSSCYITVRRYAAVTIYYCRIRALSTAWVEGHTEWSETRKFYVKPEG